MDADTEQVLKALEARYQAWSNRKDPLDEPQNPYMEMVTLIRATGLDAKSIERAVDDLETQELARHMGSAFVVTLTPKGIAGIKSAR